MWEALQKKGDRTSEGRNTQNKKGTSRGVVVAKAIKLRNQKKKKKKRSRPGGREKKLTGEKKWARRGWG